MARCVAHAELQAHLRVGRRLPVRVYSTKGASPAHSVVDAVVALPWPGLGLTSTRACRIASPQTVPSMTDPHALDLLARLLELGALPWWL